MRYKKKRQVKVRNKRHLAFNVRFPFVVFTDLWRQSRAVKREPVTHILLSELMCPLTLRCRILHLSGLVENAELFIVCLQSMYFTHANEFVFY